MNCPNCKTPTFSGSALVPIKDSSGMWHEFHEKCFTDVITGWSGCMPPSGMGYAQCVSINFSRVGIHLPGDCK